MAGSTYSTRLRFELIATGEQSGSWGTTTNTNLGTLIEEALAGVASVTHDDTANYTLTALNGGTDESRHMILEIGGALTANRNVICPSQEKLYIVKNATSGGFDIIIKTIAGSGITIPNGKSMIVYCDATNVVDGINNFPAGTTVNSVAIVTESGVQTLTSKTINLASNTLTGTTAQFNTALSDGDFVTLAGTETLSNKTHQDTLSLLSTDAGATVGPTLILDRNSASPANNDLAGTLQFLGRNNAAASKQMALFYTKWLDVTAGTEDSQILIRTTLAGANNDAVKIGSGVQVGAPTGGDLGVGTINATAISINNNDVPFLNARGGITFTDTDTGSTVGPTVELLRNSSSPANFDLLGEIVYAGKNSAAATKNYVIEYVQALDVTNGSEDGRWVLYTFAGGTGATRLDVRAGLSVGVPTGGDKGAGTINAAGDIYVNDVPVVTYSNTSQQFVTINYSDDGAGEGPGLLLRRDSASPAGGDLIGVIKFEGDNSVGTVRSYMQMTGTIDDPTDAAEDASWRLQVRRGGALNTRMLVRDGIQVGSPTGGDKGSGTINIDTGIYKDNVELPYTNAVQTWTAAQRGEVTTLSDAANISINLADSNNFVVTLAGNRTLDNPTNIVAGQSGAITVIQDAIGSRTLAYGTYYKFQGGTTPVLSTGVNAIDVLSYYVKSATEILISASYDWS